MNILKIPPLTSGGIMLSYKCSNFCRHCVYASSPRWDKWMDSDDLRLVLQNIKKCAPNHQGLHIGGGEPFLNLELTLQAIECCIEHGNALQYVETNAYWCDDESETRRLMKAVRDSGSPAILISASPFHNEFIPFAFTENAVNVGGEIFGNYNVLIYTSFFFQQLRNFERAKKLVFNRYINTIGRDIFAQQLVDYYSIIPCGRAVTRLNYLYQSKPASSFFNDNCYGELTNPHHIHVDPFCNYIVSFCAGISLGDARYLDRLYQEINLQEYPILEILVERGVEGLLKLAVDQFDYKEREEGYVAKCHLCQEIRKHIVSMTDQFEELKPVEFYENL